MLIFSNTLFQFGVTMSRRFVFVSVVYNNYDDTLDFCKSLMQMAIEKEGLVCFLVDNSDSTGIQERIDSLVFNFSFVKVLRSGRNLGYFGGFNYFFDSQFFDSSDTVVLCNNDLVFDRNFCQRFLVGSYPDDVFVVCPDVVTMDGVHQNPHHLKPITAFEKFKFDLYFSHYLFAVVLLWIKGGSRLLMRETEHFAPELKPCEINQGVGACYVLLPTFFKRIDRLFFPWLLYGEEACLSWQVRSSGGRLWFDPELVVWHAESATLSKLPKRTTYEYGRQSYWGLRKLI